MGFCRVPAQAFMLSHDRRCGGLEYEQHWSTMIQNSRNATENTSMLDIDLLGRKLIVSGLL